MDDGKFLLVTVLEDPHNGKTHFELLEGEELDVGQIEDFTDEQVIDLGVNLNKKPVFLYWLNLDLKVSESRSQKFESVADIKEFTSTRQIYCRWIKRHKENLNCVMSFHEMPDGFDENINDLLNSLSGSIFNLMKELKPDGYKMGDTKQLVVDLYNKIKEYPYEKL